MTIVPTKPVCGRLAQLGEHLLYTQGVGGSIPSPPMGCSTDRPSRRSRRAEPEPYTHRQMRMMRSLLPLGCGVVIAGCGEMPAVTAPASHPSAVEQRLARMAWAQARAGGNARPQSAVYVLSQRGSAGQASSGGSDGSTEPVYLVEVVGPFPRYPISRPLGGLGSPTIRCAAISFTVDRQTFGVLDDGCGRRFDIAKLGPVNPLRPPSLLS